MADLIASFNGHRMTTMSLHVPRYGRWVADVDLDEKIELPTDAELRLNGTSILGTVDASHSGEWIEKTILRIVGGKNMIQSVLSRKHYHNDAGVKCKTAIEDAIREAGETVGDITPPVDRLASDFVRIAQSGARTLALLGASWWTATDSRVVHVGQRTTSNVAEDYEVLGFDTRTRIVDISTDSPTAIGIGSVISKRLPSPGTVREYRTSIEGGALRITAWVDV